jgi:hypothetical protein
LSARRLALIDLSLECAAVHLEVCTLKEAEKFFKQRAFICGHLREFDLQNLREPLEAQTDSPATLSICTH